MIIVEWSSHVRAYSQRGQNSTLTANRYADPLLFFTSDGNPDGPSCHAYKVNITRLASPLCFLDKLIKENQWAVQIFGTRLIVALAAAAFTSFRFEGFYAALKLVQGALPALRVRPEPRPLLGSRWLQ